METPVTPDHLLILILGVIVSLVLLALIRIVYNLYKRIREALIVRRFKRDNPVDHRLR